MESGEQPAERIARIKQELQDVEAELAEATTMRSEAQQLGEADILPELEAVEERLQVEMAGLKSEMLRLQAEVAAAASAALRARMAKLRQSAEARSAKTLQGGRVTSDSIGPTSARVSSDVLPPVSPSSVPAQAAAQLEAAASASSSRGTSEATNEAADRQPSAGIPSSEPEQSGAELAGTHPRLAALSAKLPSDKFNAAEPWKDGAAAGLQTQVSNERDLKAHKVSVDAFPPPKANSFAPSVASDADSTTAVASLSEQPDLADFPVAPVRAGAAQPRAASPERQAPEPPPTPAESAASGTVGAVPRAADAPGSAQLPAADAGQARTPPQGAPAAAAVAAAVIDGAAAAAKGVAVVLGVPDKTADGVDKTAAAAKGYLGVQESAPVALAAPAGNGQRSSQPAVEKPPSLDAVRVPTNQPSSEAQGASPLKGSPASSPTKSAGSKPGSPSRYKHTTSKALPTSRAPSTEPTPLASPFSTHSPTSNKRSPYSDARAPPALPQNNAEAAKKLQADRSATPQPAEAQEGGFPVVPLTAGGTSAKDETPLDEPDAFSAGPLMGISSLQGKPSSAPSTDAWSTIGSDDLHPSKSGLQATPRVATPTSPEEASWSSANPFMDFKMSGGLSGSNFDFGFGAAPSEAGSSQHGFAPESARRKAPAQALSHESAFATPTHSFPADPAPAQGFEGGSLYPASSQDQGFEASFPASGNQAEASPWAPTSWDQPSNQAHQAPPSEPAPSNQSAATGLREVQQQQLLGTFSSPQRGPAAPQQASRGVAPPQEPPRVPAQPSRAPPQPREAPKAPAAGPKPAFAAGDAWADFDSRNAMLSLDLNTFGAPTEATGSPLAVSLPSKPAQNIGGSEGFASADSWDGGSSRSHSPDRSLPSRHSHHADDNPFDNPDFPGGPGLAPEKSQGSAHSASGMLRGLSASLKNVNKSKNILKGDSVKKLGDAMKVKWRGRTTTEDDSEQGPEAESDTTSRNVVSAFSQPPARSAAIDERHSAPVENPPVPQDSLGVTWDRQPISRPQQSQPVLLNQWSDVPSQPTPQAPAAAASPRTSSEGGEASRPKLMRPRGGAPEVLHWPRMNKSFRSKCEDAFRKRGRGSNFRGMQLSEAVVLFDRMDPVPTCGAEALFNWCDLDCDGFLNQRESCLLMYMLKQPERLKKLPPPINPAQAAFLLGDRIPEGDVTIPGHLSPWLQATRSSSQGDRLPLPPQETEAPTELTPEVKALMAKGYNEEDCKRALFLHANDIKPALEWLTERYGALQSGGGSFDLSSSLHLGQAGAANGRSAPRGFEFGRDASSTGARGPLLQILVERADVSHYKKALEGPFFAVTLRDGNGDLVENELATPPGHYDREHGHINADHAVTFSTPISELPEGTAVYFEVRHYKTAERRLSTLAWSFIPVEVFILHHHQATGGPGSPRRSGPKIRTGPMFLSLYHKPTDTGAHARTQLHHGSGITRKGPRPVSKNHDLFISVLVA